MKFVTLGIDFFWSFCRHNDLDTAVKDIGSVFGAGDSFQDVFPIQIRLFVLGETNSLVVKIYQKVSCGIYSPSVVSTARHLLHPCTLIDALRIWFSEWLNLFLKLDKAFFSELNISVYLTNMTLIEQTAVLKK